MINNKLTIMKNECIKKKRASPLPTTAHYIGKFNTTMSIGSQSMTVI